MVKTLLLNWGNTNATDFYLSILESALKSYFGETIRVYDMNEVEDGDTLLIINPRITVMALRRFKNLKVYTWFQGVGPEESFYTSHNLRGFFSKLKCERYERIALKQSIGCIFVSEAMRNHYKKKYGYLGNNYFIMPCFNQALDETCFSDDKYSMPTFLYSGNLTKWQCFPQTLKLFKRIKEVIPEAQLTVLTYDTDMVKKLVDRENIQSVEIRPAVKYTELPKILSQFKYGFLLRENIVLNNVATPTKMNTYLGCGIIPITTTAVHAYNDLLKNCNYAVINDSEDEIIDKLLVLEKQQISSDNVKDEYSLLFDSYYNRDLYIRKFCVLLNKVQPHGR